MKRLDGLSDAERAAVDAMRCVYGRRWKMVVRDLWMKGGGGISFADGVNHGPALQALRNRFGPEWLVRFRPEARTI